MRQLGLRIGDQVRVGSYSRPLTVVGTVTLPSFGVILTDHVSLGRGAHTARTHPAGRPGTAGEPDGQPVPKLGVKPVVPVSGGHRCQPARRRQRTCREDHHSQPGRDARWHLSARLAARRAGPERQPDGQPAAALATGVAAAAVLPLGRTVLASVRQRRRELALLKALGLRGRQLRAVVAWQTSITLVVATAVGVPLGLVAGRWAWTSFANAIGVVPTPSSGNHRPAAARPPCSWPGICWPLGPAVIAAQEPAADHPPGRVTLRRSLAARVPGWLPPCRAGRGWPLQQLAPGA